MSLKQYFVGFALAAIFTLAMISFGNNMAIDNDARSILSNPAIANMSSSLNQSLNTFETQIQKQRDVIEGETDLKTGFGTLVIFGIIGAGRIFTGMIVGIVNILFGGLSDILGIPSIVIGVFFSIVLISLMLAAWRLVKRG